MNNEEKILWMLEALTSEVKALTSEVKDVQSEVKDVRSEVKEVRSEVKTLASEIKEISSKVDNLEARMDAAEKQAARNLDFIIEEFERSDKRILGYLEDMALNKAGEQAKASFGLV